MEQALTVVVLGLVGVRLVSAARYACSDEGRSTSREVIGRIRWRYVWPVPLVLTAVVLVASVLLEVPGLDWGWWTTLGGEGNPVTGTTSQTAGTVWEWLVPVVFLLLVLPALPLFALAEERIFRRGAEHWRWPRRAWKLLAFGAVHALIGIPVGVALALSVGGAYFMWVYLRRFRATGSPREAMLESAAAHTAYNACILTLVLVVVVLDAVGVG